MTFRTYVRTLEGMGSNKRYPRQPAPDARRRHCWVLATATERGPWPGLVLDWRRTRIDEWQALVVYVPRENQVVQEWFAAGLLRPLDAPPPSRASLEAARYSVS